MLEDKFACFYMCVNMGEREKHENKSKAETFHYTQDRQNIWLVQLQMWMRMNCKIKQQKPRFLFQPIISMDIIQEIC